MKNSLIILTSKLNKYQGQIDKIIRESSFNVIKAFIEEYGDYTNNFVYSFTRLINVSNNVINYKFYLNYLNKKQVQELLSNKVNTPKLLETVDSIAYLKENKHEGIVKIITNKDNINLSNYYLEQIIEGIENKYYYVFDLLFDNESKIIDKDLINIALIISNSLHLDVFSFDVIKKDNINYVIDVNISPGFYKSDIARNYFINYIERIIYGKYKY